MKAKPAAADSASGYSGTPLAKKLGIKVAARVLLIDAPTDYAQLVAPLPDGVVVAGVSEAAADLVHCFVRECVLLAQALNRLRKSMSADAVLWISWPKKASGEPTDITEGVIRDEALPLGWVDIKVCAIDATWSGLKLVVRRDLRGTKAI